MQLASNEPCAPPRPSSPAVTERTDRSGSAAALSLSVKAPLVQRRGSWLRKVNPRQAELIGTLRLEDFEHTMTRQDGVRAGVRHRRRQVIRVEAEARERNPDSSSGVFIKREFGCRLKDMLANLLAGFGWKSPLGREWTLLSAMRAAGLGCPEPVIFAQRGWIWSRGYLAVCPVSEDVVPLKRLLAEVSGQQRREAIRAVAGQVARMHEAGFDHPDLYARHVWVSRKGSWRVFFLDMARSRIRRRVAWRDRVRDLALLDCTLTAPLVRRADRLLFLKTYLAACTVKRTMRHAARQLLRRSQSIARRRQIWNWTFARSRDRHVWLNRTDQQALREAGLDQFDKVMHGQGGTMLRRLSRRENWRLPWKQVDEGDGPAAYLKRHRARDFFAAMMARWSRRRDLSAGSTEARRIIELQHAGIDGPRVLAYGQRPVGLATMESFVFTEELPGAVPLDRFLRDRFATCSGPVHRNRDLLALLDEVAAVARRFHEAGYNHRDFYCCHFFIREPLPGEFQVTLIDLQRVQRRRWLRRRWIVKDLAQLSYSAPPTVVGDRLRLAFLHRYLGLSRLRREDKRLIRQVMAKHRWITRHGYPP